MISVKVDTAALKDATDKFAGKVIDSQPHALIRGANKLLLESGKQVPLDTGWLQSTGEVLEDDGITLVYRGPYAAFQHEGVRADGTHVVQNYQHGRKKKYITDPLDEQGSEILAIIGGDVQSEVME